MPVIQSATDQQTRWQRLSVPATTIGGLAVAALALHLRDPHSQGSWGVCPSYALWGVYCPGCGGLRAVNDLSNGDVLAAAHSNLVFVALVPVIVFILGRWMYDAWSGQTRDIAFRGSKVAAVALGAVVVLFTVWRNLPGGGWLQP